MMASKSSCGLLGWSTRVRCRPTLVCPMSPPVRVWSRLPWRRTFHPLHVSLVSMFGFGTKANHKSVPSVVPTATVLRTVPSTGCVVVAVSQGTWPVSAPSAVRPLLLLLPLFLILLPASTPSVSEDEDDPDYVLSSASETGSCSGDEEVLRSVPTSVLAARVGKRSAPPPVPSDESSVDLRDNELSPESDPVSGTPESASAVVPSDPVSDPVPDPVPGMPESASAVDPVTVPDPVPVPGTPVSASAVVVPDVKTSVSKPRKKKPRPSKSAVASSPAKSSSVPVKSVPVTSTPVAESPPLTYWEASRDTGRGYVVKDCTGAQVYFDFGRLTRSIEIESTTFEYDRFVKYVHHNVDRPYMYDYVKASLRVPRTTTLTAGTPLEFPKSSK